MQYPCAVHRAAHRSYAVARRGQSRGGSWRGPGRCCGPPGKADARHNRIRQNGELVVGRWQLDQAGATPLTPRPIGWRHARVLYRTHIKTLKNPDHGMKINSDVSDSDSDYS